MRYSYNRLSDRYPSHHRRHPLALFLRGLDITSALVTTMHRNDYVMITAHNPGWFTLDLNVASSSMDRWAVSTVPAASNSDPSIK